MYQRAFTGALAARLREPRRFIQIVQGPRQVGKTTAIRQVLADLELPSHYATADTAALQSAAWLDEQWAVARRIHRESGGPAVLAIDEIQKVPDWSAWVKRCWDEDSFASHDIRLVTSGSSPLLMQQGLSESLAGRFEVLPMAHWSWPECRDAFGWDLDTYIYYGGYPGAAALVGDPARWRAYILDSVVETTVSRDILLMRRVDKPALMRRLFHLACSYAGRELTFEKMVGQLRDVGNTTTIAHYLDLLGQAGLVSGLQKFAGDVARRRRSTPKLAVHNTALLSATADGGFEEVRRNPAEWGRRVDAAVGAHLIACAQLSRSGLYYWRTKVLGADLEGDYVTVREGRVTAIEVKTSERTGSLEGLAAFRAAFGSTVTTTLVGPNGVPLDEFLASDG